MSGSIVGIGVDIVEHERFAALLQRRSRVLERLFTPDELEYANRFSGMARVARLASRFAAKEAVSKAMGISLFSISMKEIAVITLASGAPSVALLGRCGLIASQRHVEHVSLSISHERSNSIAFAVAFGGAGTIT